MPASSELDLVANTAIDLVERHAVVGFARLCRMVVCGEFVFFLAHLFWPSSLGEGGYTALEALAVAV